MKEFRNAFERARQEHVAAEQEIAAIDRRIISIDAKIEQARAECSAVDREIAALGNGDDLDKAVAAARKVAVRKVEADASATVLERARAGLREKRDRTLLKLAAAQVTAYKAQKSFFAALYAERMREFVEGARDPLKRLLHATAAFSVFEQPAHFPFEHRLEFRAGLNDLLNKGLRIALGELGNTLGFEFDIDATDRDSLPVRELDSRCFDREQRARLREKIGDDQVTSDHLAEAICPKPQIAPSRADPTMIEAARRVKQLTHSLEQARAQLAQAQRRAAEHPGDRACASDLAEAKAIVADLERNVANWQSKLAA